MRLYTIEFSSLVRKQLKRIPKKDSRKIVEKIESLAVDPRPYGFKKLVYHVESFRVRVGNYRIIYSIFDRQLIVCVVEIADRRDAY